MHKNREYFEKLENNPRDPSHWHALYLDQSVPFNLDAKAAFLYDSGRKSKQFVLPFARLFGRFCIILLQLFKVFFPKLINAPKTLHWCFILV